MKIIIAILITAFLTITVCAANLSVTAKVTQFSGADGSVEVTLKNTATKISVPLRVTVTYVVNNVTETCSSLPFEATIVHPVLVNNFKLDIAAPWFQMNTPQPFTLNDGESTTFTLTFAKIVVLL